MDDYVMLNAQSIVPSPGSHNGGDIVFTAGKGWAEPGGKTWPDGAIRFVIGDEEVLRIDHDGMTYKGRRIEDAGEAHATVIEFFNKHFHNPT